MQKYINLISYFGGKFPHLKWLINQFPKGNYHFVDIMCGSANVALNVKYPLVTINDTNDDVVNLFRILREHEEELTRRIYFTPFSRKELENIITDCINNVQVTDIERARRYFVKSQLGYGANGSQNNHYGTGFEWKLHRAKFYRTDNWNLKLRKFAAIAAKLRTFQIENCNSLELFEKVNHKGCIVYFDPPYLLSLRKSKKRYKNEVNDEFHRQIAGVIKNAKCFVAISGYDSPLYDEIFSNLIKTMDKEKNSNVGKVPTTECLWTNYDPATINGTYKMNFKV